MKPLQELNIGLQGEGDAKAFNIGLQGEGDGRAMTRPLGRIVLGDHLE